MDRSFVYLMNKANKDCNRSFRTRNMVGTKLYGNSYIGTYNSIDFYLGLRFGVFLFLPIIPMGAYIQFKNQNNQDCIYGSVTKEIINEAGYCYKSLLFISFKHGIIMGILQFLFLCIVLYIMRIILTSL